MSFLEPDRYFSRLSQVDIDRDLLALGYRHVLLDVDNTILARDTHEVPRDVGFWLAKAREAGLTFCLVSNNWHEGVYQLGNRLSLPIVAKAVKPLPPAFLMAMKKIDAKRADTVIIGDQLVTDVMGAHFLGMQAYLLAPLVEQDLRHTLILRNFERMVMGERQPEGAGVPSTFQSAGYSNEISDAPQGVTSENECAETPDVSAFDRSSNTADGSTNCAGTTRAKEQRCSS